MIFPFESISTSWPKILIGDHRRNQVFPNLSDTRRLQTMTTSNTACSELHHKLSTGVNLIAVPAQFILNNNFQFEQSTTKTIQYAVAGYQQSGSCLDMKFFKFNVR